MQALIVDVAETFPVAQGWARGHKFNFPVAWDSTGAAAALWAPEDVLPDLPRFQIPIGSNLLIDRGGKIRFYSLLDTKNFDAQLVSLRSVLDSLLAQEVKDSKPDEKSKPVLKTGEIKQCRVRPCGTATAVLPLRVGEGLHVQANPAGLEYLIPLELRVRAADGLSPGAPVYPKGRKLRLKGSDFDLFVYSGDIELTLPFSASTDAEKGRADLTGWVHYQGCDDRTCFAPDSIRVLVPVVVE